jgi:ParB-like chromosome segregation protein Spo0J
MESKFLTVELSKIQLSKHNPRKTREAAHIEQIAKSI